MNKVQLPKGVIDCIELCKKKGISEYYIVVLSRVTNQLFRDYDGETITALETIRDFGDKYGDALLYGLVNGYEAEQTPEDKLMERYNYYISSDDRKLRGIAIGIKEAIGILGIKIEGLNT